jgi:hypothetical protein
MQGSTFLSICRSIKNLVKRILLQNLSRSIASYAQTCRLKVLFIAWKYKPWRIFSGDVQKPEGNLCYTYTYSKKTFVTSFPVLHCALLNWHGGASAAAAYNYMRVIDADNIQYKYTSWTTFNWRTQSAPTIRLQTWCRRRINKCFFCWSVTDNEHRLHTWFKWVLKLLHALKKAFTFCS